MTTPTQPAILAQVRRKGLRCELCGHKKLSITAVNGQIITDPAHADRALQTLPDTPNAPTLSLGCDQCGHQMHHPAAELLPAPGQNYVASSAAINWAVLALVVVGVAVGLVAVVAEQVLESENGAEATLFWPSSSAELVGQTNTPQLVVLFADDCAWCRGNHSAAQALARQQTPSVRLLYLNTSTLSEGQLARFDRHEETLPAFYVLDSGGAVQAATWGNPTIDELAALLAQ